MFFEDQLGINRHWLQMRWGAEEVPTLITHYAGAMLPFAPHCTSPNALSCTYTMYGADYASNHGCCLTEYTAMPRYECGRLSIAVLAS